MSDYFGAMGTALFSVLSGGSALTTELGGTAIYAEQAPDNSQLPYVVFNHQGGGLENLNADNLRNNVWFVRGYATTRAQANRIDGGCQDLLHKKPLTVTGYTNFWTVREDDVSLVETPPDEQRIFMAGGMYRIRITGA